MGVPAADPEAYNRDQIPVIDFAGVEDSAQRAWVIKQLIYAFETFGFFEAINSSVPVDRLDDAFDVSRSFFEQPAEKKTEAFLDHPENKPMVGAFQIGLKAKPVLAGITCHVEEYLFRHYHQSPDLPHTAVPQGILSAAKNAHGSLQASAAQDLTFSTLPNVYPSTVPQYREKVTLLQESLGTFMDLLLDLVSESLGLDPTFIRNKYHDNSTPRQFLFHYYPKKSDEDVDEAGTQIGLVPHKDASILTIVGQGFDATGLQINVTGEKWVTAVPSKGGLIINGGEVLQAWSNGRYKSITHRVINNPRNDRYSFAYFCFPCEGPYNEKVIEAIPELITPQNSKRYKSFTFYEYFENKLSKDGIDLLLPENATEF